MQHYDQLKHLEKARVSLFNYYLGLFSDTIKECIKKTIDLFL